MQVEGHHVSTVALAPGTQSSPLDVETLGATRRGLATLRALRERMASADVTIAHGSTTLMACALAGFPRCRFVYRQISDSRFWASTWRRRLRTAAFLRRATAIVALSDEARRTLMDHVWAPPGKISVVPNGVPMGDFRPPTDDERRAARQQFDVPHDAFCVLFIGALVAEKGADLAIEAAASVDGAVLVMAGDGPERTRLEEAGRSLMQERFISLGPVDEPADAYAAADVLVLPSRGGDSMPATLIEAGFCALPSVATPVGSITEVLEDGATGLIVPVGDVKALRESLAALQTDADLCRRLGGAAHDRCLGRFEITRVAEDWIDVLSHAVG